MGVHATAFVTAVSVSSPGGSQYVFQITWSAVDDAGSQSYSTTSTIIVPYSIRPPRKADDAIRQGVADAIAASFIAATIDPADIYFPMTN